MINLLRNSNLKEKVDHHTIFFLSINDDLEVSFGDSD